MSKNVNKTEETKVEVINKETKVELDAEKEASIVPAKETSFLGKAKNFFKTNKVANTALKIAAGGAVLALGILVGSRIPRKWNSSGTVDVDFEESKDTDVTYETETTESSDDVTYDTDVTYENEE